LDCLVLLVAEAQVFVGGDEVIFVSRHSVVV